jgi:hypothetical protein
MKIETVQQNGGKWLHLAIGKHDSLLDGKDVEGLIEQLSFHRSAMKPQVAEALSPTHHYTIEMHPGWYAEPHPVLNGLVLFMRHSGYGWTGFYLPKESLARLHREFRKCIAAPAKTGVLPN